MTESFTRFWEELMFYGPAFASIFAVAALGILGLLLLIIFRQIKKKGKTEVFTRDDDSVNVDNNQE